MPTFGERTRRAIVTAADPSRPASIVSGAAVAGGAAVLTGHAAALTAAIGLTSLTGGLALLGLAGRLFCAACQEGA
jgi:hypothetical protein